MKLLFYFLFVTTLTSNPPLADQVRDEYYSTKTEEEVLDFLEKWDGVNCLPCQAYVIAAEMERALFTSNIVDKFKYFNEAKAKLDSAIAQNPEVLDFRFIRFRVQSNVPKIANYSQNLEEDYTYIKAHHSDPQITAAFRSMIEEHILSAE